MSTRVGEIRKNFVNTTTKKRKTNPSKIAVGRHVKWHPGQNYICISKSEHVFKQLSDIDTYYANNLIQESLFSIFKNVDTNLNRNETIPVYEAVYLCENGQYYKVQKKHLKMAYTNAKKLENSKAWTFTDKQLPYWVDRFIFTRLNQ